MTDTNNDISLPTSVYLRYALGFLALVVVVPALLQGVEAFVGALFWSVRSLLLLAVAGGVGTGAIALWQKYQSDRAFDRDRLQNLFYQFVREGNNRFTVLDFAAKVQLSPRQAKDFLDAAAKECNADFEVSDRGDIYYCFPTIEAARSSALSAGQPLIQAHLARRLNVSASSISYRKLKPGFSEWVQQKDPEGIAWEYCQDSKQFYPRHRR